jgi:hypothetical protein
MDYACDFRMTAFQSKIGEEIVGVQPEGLIVFPVKTRELGVQPMSSRIIALVY